MIGSYNSPRVRNKILRSTSVGSQYDSTGIKSLKETSTTNSSSGLGGNVQLTWKLAYTDDYVQITFRE